MSKSGNQKLQVTQRGIDSLLELKDEDIIDSNIQYLQEKDVFKLLGMILQQLLLVQPDNPMEFIYNCLELDYEDIIHDPILKISNYRKGKLIEAFNSINEGQPIDYKVFSKYITKFGGRYITKQEVSNIFQQAGINQDDVNQSIGLQQFLKFYAPVCQKFTNPEFIEIIMELVS